MIIYSLSHTDLDGYGAQFVLRKYLSERCKLRFFNSNYGREIDEKFNAILDDIATHNEPCMLIITDLNPIFSNCERFAYELSEYPHARILLLDHHISGAQSHEQLPWYYLDDTRCATKITYDFLAGIYGEKPELAALVDVINAIDIWLDDSPHFELGKVMLGMIAQSRELNRIMFAAKSHEYYMYLIQEAAKFINQPNAHVALDDALHFIKKRFFAQGADINANTLTNHASDFVVDLLSANKDKLALEYCGHKGIMCFDVGNVSVIGNDFLQKNPEFDFFLEINGARKISLRANGKLDVCAMAARCFAGGGHANASGGSWFEFKSSSVFENMYEQVNNYLMTFK